MLSTVKAIFPVNRAYIHWIGLLTVGFFCGTVLEGHASRLEVLTRRNECAQYQDKACNTVIEADNAAITDAAHDYRNRANLYLINGKYSKALADYNQSLILLPTLGAYVGRGDVEFATNNYQLAIKDYEAALLIAPDAQAYNGLATTFYRLGKCDKALLAYEMAIHLKPEWARPYRNRAILKKAQGDSKGSSEDFARAMALESR